MAALDSADGRTAVDTGGETMLDGWFFAEGSALLALDGAAMFEAGADTDGAALALGESDFTTEGSACSEDKE